MFGPILLAIIVAQATTTPPVARPAGSAQQPAAPQTQATPEQPWPPAGVLHAGSGTTSPRLIKQAKPSYTRDAMRAKISGVVSMDVVVQADGTVGEVRVTRSLDKVFGLDDEAVRTVKKWQFTAGKKDGVPVPVLVEVEMTFTLRKDR